MSEFATTESAQDIDVDAIWDKAYGGGENSTVAPEPVSSAPIEAPKQEAPNFKEYEFAHRGQQVKIREDDPRFTQWMSMGYDYAQNNSALKTEREEFEKSRGNFEKTWSPYKEIDEYARDNPDWWQHVDQSYKQKLSSQQDVPDSVKKYLESVLGPIQQDIPLVKQYLTKQQADEAAKIEKDQDTQLESSVKSVMERNPQIDFKAKDPSGMSLEHRVLDYGIKNQLLKFEDAFKAYYYDESIKQAESRGRESYMQELNKRKKLGILDNVPTQGKIPNLTQASKIRSWSDPQLSSENILKELNLL